MRLVGSIVVVMVGHSDDKELNKQAKVNVFIVLPTQLIWTTGGP